MVLRLSGQTSIFGVVFFVSKSLLELRDKRTEKKLQVWPESLGAMFKYWYIECGLLAAVAGFHEGLSHSKY